MAEEQRNFTLSPFGEGTVTETLHTGRTFNVYRANLCGQDVVLKTPSPSLTGDNLHRGTCHLPITGIFCASTAHGINTVASDLPVDQINPFEAAAGLLMAEAQIIDWTNGAWNHSIIGRGTWDGLSLRHDGSRHVGWQNEPSRFQFLPVIIMPYHHATAFSALPKVSQRHLFPHMLISLWDALCSVHHGDLAESNILLSQNKDVFHIIDPGVLLSSDAYASPCAESKFVSDFRCIFTTTAINYPIYPPFMDVRFEAIQDGNYKLVDYLAGHAPLQTPRPWYYKNPPGFSLSIREPDRSLSHVQRKPQPSLPDLLALGIMYYRILTGGELFLGQPILPEKPLWQSKFPINRESEIYQTLVNTLSHNYLENTLDKADITPAERDLAYALLNLSITDRNHLLRLVNF